MKRYQLIAALTAFIITFILCTVLKGCTVKAGAKQKAEATRSEKSEDEAIDGVRPLAGLSLALKKAIEKSVDVAKILLERWQQEQERRKQEQEEIRLLAEVIYHENWYTDKERKAAYYTGAVVMNRVKSKNWPNTVKEVVYQKRQYAVVPKLFTEKIPDECYQMAKDIYRNGTPDVPANVVYQATFIQGSGDWIDPINGEHFCYE